MIEENLIVEEPVVGDDELIEEDQDEEIQEEALEEVDEDPKIKIEEYE